MQPTVVKNSGLAAYKPPPKTVVSYVPWTPPPPSSERETTFAASGAGEAQSTPAIPPPKSEVATAQARANIPRQQHRRVYSAPRPVWGYAAPRQWGFRPWF
jgi:hypothetical protein